MAYENGLGKAKSEAWAAMLQKELEKTTVGLNICDTKFEGVFMGGAKTVHYPRIRAVSGGDLANPYSKITLGQIQSEDDSFTLDCHKYWAIPIAKADLLQMKASPNSAIIDALKQYYKERWEEEIFKKAVASASIVIGGSLGLTLDTGKKIYDAILNSDEKMSDGNVPMSNRFAIISPADLTLLKQYMVERNTPLGDEVLENGYAGKVDGVKIYMSNMLPKVGNIRNIILGQGKPVSFASDIKPEVIHVAQETQSDSFADVIKSQSRYGAKVFLSDAIRLVNLVVKTA